MLSQKEIDYIWEQATTVPGYNSQNIRKDPCGAWIIRNLYGSHESIYGWEIDHILPIVMGGDDNADNLRAMQWENCKSKGVDYPVYNSKVQAEGAKNVYKSAQFTINQGKQQELANIYNK